MSDIKIPVIFFGDSKIQILKKSKKGTEKILFFLQVLCMAGQANDGGNLIISQGVPHTIGSLATCTGRSKQFVEEALEMLSQLNMVALSNGVYTICDWQDYQIVDQAEKKKEQDRKRAKAYYYRKKAANDSHVSLTLVSRENHVSSHVKSHAKEKKETERTEKTEKKNQEKNKENREIEKVKENISPFIPRETLTLENDVFSLYEKVIQPLIPYIGEKLVDLIQELGEEKVKRGIEIAAEKGVRNFNYIATVARNINKPVGNRNNWDDAYKQLMADLDSKNDNKSSQEEGRWLN